MKTHPQQEEQFYISGWEDREDNGSQQVICSRNSTSEKESLIRVTKKTSTLPSKVPLRGHFRYKTKDNYRQKISDIRSLKRSKEMFEQQFWKQDEFKLNSHRINNEQQSSPMIKIHQETEAFYPKLENRQINPQKENTENVQNTLQQLSKNYLEKYTLFTGISQKRKKRKYLLRTNLTQFIQRPKLKTDQTAHKFVITTSKCQLAKIDKIIQQSQKKAEIHKKGLTFPLYFRQFNQKQPKGRKNKHSSAVIPKQLKNLMSSFEFTDDNLFSSKNIRS